MIVAGSKYLCTVYLVRGNIPFLVEFRHDVGYQP
jgi:hypothetical protein